MSDVCVDDITCIIVVENYNELVKYAIASIKKFTMPCPKILVCLNVGNSKAVQSRQGPNQLLNLYKNDERVRVFINPVDPKIKNTSARHGTGLNKLVGMVTTKYTAIIESDVILTSDAWSKLDDSFDAKLILRGKKDIPYYHVCFAIFKTELFRDVDWRPGVGRTGYNDTGWQMHDKILQNNANIKFLSTVSCGSAQATTFKKTMNKKSFEIHDGNKTIAAHFGRGSDLARISQFKQACRQWEGICNLVASLDQTKPKSPTKANTRRRNPPPRRIVGPNKYRKK